MIEKNKKYEEFVTIVKLLIKIYVFTNQWGSYSLESYAGAFCFSNHYGNDYNDISFRPVLSPNIYA